MTSDARQSSEPEPRGCVLVVDDDDDILEAVCGVLEDAGYEVVAAFGGHQAWDALHSTEPTPDMLLVDLMMPRGDGWNLVDRIRQDPRVAHVPVAVMTAGDPRLLDTVHGAAAHLLKPLRYDALLAVVAASVSSARRAQSVAT